MKWFLWLLLLVNAALLVYFNIEIIMPKPVVVSNEIAPEKLIILNQQSLEAMPKKVETVVAEVVEKPISSCYEWGNFTATNLPSAQVALAKFGLEGTVKQLDNNEAGNQSGKRFWVYYPPFKNAQLAQAKADEIKTLGVSDLFIVQDSQWRHAISFGLFQDEQLATNLLNDLQAKGVRGATKALRSLGKNSVGLFIAGVTPEAALELQKISPEFVGSELKVAACP